MDGEAPVTIHASTQAKKGSRMTEESGSARRGEGKGADLMLQAEKKLKSFSLFSAQAKTEAAMELYDKAAAQFKMTKQWDEAGDAYIKMAECAEKIGNEGEAVSAYTNAAKAYKNGNTYLRKRFNMLNPFESRRHHRHFDDPFSGGSWLRPWGGSYGLSDPFRSDPFFSSALAPWGNIPIDSFKVDVAEREKDFLIHADLPGFNPNQVKVEIENGRLKISGEKSEVKETEEKNYKCRERNFGSVMRQLMLPENVNASGMQKNYENGVLSITLPKTAEALKQGESGGVNIHTQGQQQQQQGQQGQEGQPKVQTDQPQQGKMQTDQSQQQEGMSQSEAQANI
jgi:HSP20 family protein